MVANRVAENVLGTIGTVLWTAQLLPQVWKSWREKSTEGFSHWLVLLWGLSAGFLGIYVIVQDLNIPLIIQPQLFGFLSIISWGQCLYYGLKWSRLRSTIAVLCVLSFIGGFEAGMVFALKSAYDHGNSAPVKAFGVLNTVLLSLALFPQYWEIYKHGEVIGISIPFIFIDMMGGIFSDLSLAFKETFDVYAGVAYTLVVILDAVIIVSAVVLNPRAKRRRANAASPGTALNESISTQPETLTTSISASEIRCASVAAPAALKEYP
ncbi:hypothetical protein HGRIS_004631 [Hohenbuehelia grisea]|uniref:PQ-loop-domain-containing protein n=1 Tax=Hohenbuehelia grisea TaxID=104357 RepID=A0ABR3JCW4_9AGAR